MLLQLLKLDILFVLERSRDKYTVTLHGIKLSVSLYSQVRLHFSLHNLSRKIIMRKLFTSIEINFR